MAEAVFCTSVGHEQLPAAAVGVYNDGDVAVADVAYCGECATLLARDGEFRVTRVLDPVAFGTEPCPHCGGTGRVPRSADRH